MFLSFFGLFHCRVPSPQPVNELKGPVPEFAFKRPLSNLEIVSPAKYSIVRSRVVSRIIAEKSCKLEISKRQIQKIFISEVPEDFPPAVTARLIHNVFDPDLRYCSNQTCTQFTTRTFGPNLRKEMAEMQQLAQKAQAKSAPSFDPQTQTDTNVPKGISLTRRAFCGAGLLAAFSLLNPPLVKAVTLENSEGYDPSFDLRLKSPMVSQGHTGSCHAFATAEFLRHSELGLSVDIARFFVDYWTWKLGPNLETALTTEVIFQKSVLNKLQKSLEGTTNPESRTKALKEFFDKIYHKIEDDPQGGNLYADIQNLRSHGTVLENSSDLPKLTFDELGKLTEAMENARLETLKIAYHQGFDKVTDQTIRDGMRPTYEKLYAISFQSKDHPSRSVVKDKLRKYKFIVKAFHKDDIKKSAELFFKNMNKSPLYIQTTTHATAVVGYDHSKKTFIIRNSWYTDYTELTVDEVFNNLDGYGFMQRLAE